VVASQGEAVGGPEKMRDRLVNGLVTLTWLWIVAPRVLQTVTGPKYRSSVGVDAPENTASVALLTTLLTLALFGFCLLVILVAYREARPAPLGPLILLLSPWVFLAVRDLYEGSHPSKASLVYPMVVTALWLLRPKLSALVRLGYLVGLAAVICVVLGAVLPDKGLLRTYDGSLVTGDKALFNGGILVGFLTHGNNLGQFLAMGIPLVATIPRRSHRLVLLGFTGLALFWSASRSSFLAVGIAVLVALAIGLTRPSARTVVGPVLALSPFGLVVLMPFVTTDPEAFTNRGSIWAQSLGWWRDSPYVGLGSDWYQVIGHTSDRLAATVFHGHNQMVQLLVTGGVVLLGLATLMIVAVAVRSGRLAAAGHPVGVVYLAALGGTCILEKSFAFVDNSSMFPVFVLPLAVLAFTDIARLADRDAGLETPSEQALPGRSQPAHLVPGGS